MNYARIITCRYIQGSQKIKLQYKDIDFNIYFSIRAPDW